jgi:hypothetical protein
MRWYLGALTLLAACNGARETETDPGRVTLHRLNIAEYNNTVHDLLGTNLEPANDFPADDRAYGFDTVGDVLRVGTLHAELYEGAAAAMIGDVLATNWIPQSSQFELTGGSGGQTQGGYWLFYTAGTLTQLYTAPTAGRYHLTFRAYQQPAGTEDAALTVEVPGMAIQTIPVAALQASPGIYELDINLPAGSNTITVGFGNDFYDDVTMADRNLWIDYMVVDGPYDATTVDETRRTRILTCSNLAATDCQNEILTKFAKRAWRRPPTDAEIDRLRSLVTDAIGLGSTAEDGIRTALQSILVSPHFLYRVEVDPTPNDKTPHPVTSWELASRLSYFLWSSMPDDELFAAAESGALLEPDELERHVRRMLDDDKAVALVDNFAGQWLFTRALSSQVDPEPSLYPAWDEELREAMREETRRYFQAFLRDEAPMNEFLTADWTYANDRLATFYGVTPPGTNEHVLVSLAESPRRGFLGQASFLRVTSRPKRTSPVLRGKWVLDNLLCTSPPPPPPGVEGGVDTADLASLTLRERLEKHQEDPVCASCHSAMDPIGFALENFDAIGQYRATDGGREINTTGHLFGDIPFANAIELFERLSEQPYVYRCMVEKLYTYSGRPPLRIDAVQHIEELTQAFIDSDYSLRELLVAMTTHISFTHRRGEP